MPFRDRRVPRNAMLRRAVDSTAIDDLQSDDFVTTVSGWKVWKDGTAEFQNVTARGTLYATGGEIDWAYIINASIDTADIADLAVTNAKIANATIQSGKIAANTITAGNIAAGTITTTEIAASTITGGNIAASTITASNIQGNTITASQIAGNTITASEIAAGTITTTEIASNTITAANIAASTITGTEINVSTLSAIQTNTGSLTVNGTITIAVASSGKLTFDQDGTEIRNEAAKGLIIAGGTYGEINLDDNIAVGGNITIQTGGEIRMSGSTDDIVFRQNSGGTELLRWDQSDDRWEFNKDAHMNDKDVTGVHAVDGTSAQDWYLRSGGTTYMYWDTSETCWRLSNSANIDLATGRIYGDLASDSDTYWERNSANRLDTICGGTIYAFTQSVFYCNGRIDMNSNYIEDYNTSTQSATAAVFSGNRLYQGSSGDHYKTDFSPLDVDTAWRAVGSGGWTFRYDQTAENVDAGEHPLVAGVRAQMVHDALGDDAPLFVSYDEKDRPQALYVGSTEAALLTALQDLRERVEQLEESAT